MACEPEFEKLLEMLHQPAKRALYLSNIKTFDRIYQVGKRKLLHVRGIDIETIKIIEGFTGRKLPD